MQNYFPFKNANSLPNPDSSSFWRNAFAILGIILLMGIISIKVAVGQTLYDSFADGNFTASPVWAGSTGQYTIVANSDASAGATGSNTIRLNAPATAATRYLSSQIATWDAQQTWRFFIGRRAQAFTGSNQAYFYLYANETDLTSATVDGYRIAIGDDAGGDDLRLEYIVNNAVSTTVIATSTTPIPNGLTDIGIMVRVTRSNTGIWSIFTSTVPTVNGTGAIATDIPSDANTAVSQGSATNNTLVPAANGFIGIANLHSTGANAIVSTEWDQIYFNTAPAPVTPSITVSGTSLPKFFANFGFASSGQQFTVEAANIGTNNLTVGPLAGYEFSTSSTFASVASSLSFTPTAGNVSSTIIHARLISSNAIGNYNGNFVVDASGSGATAQNIAVTGQVYGNGIGSFTAGNLITLRVGETAGPALSSAAAPIFLDEYTPTGTFVQSKAVPFNLNALGTNNRRFTMSGTSTSEGYLNLSPDGQYLTFAGYDATVGTTAITSTTSSTTNRVVARVEQDGTINTTTRISDGYDQNNIRSAATVDGNFFWTGGTGNTGTGGTRYMPLGNTGTSTQVSTTITNSRGTAIYNSQLYNTSQSGSNIGVNTVGTGLPTTAGQVTSVLTGTTTNIDLTNPHGFVFVDQDDNGTPDVMYVADANLGLVKFSNASGTWTKRGALPNPSGRNVYGVTATAVGLNRRIYLNLGTVSGIATEIYTFLDNSAISLDIASNGTDIITACGAPIITSPNPANVGFKGVTFAPVDVPTPTVDHTFTSAGINIAQGTVNAPLYRIQCDVTVGNALLTGVTVSTAGLYAGSDFNNFRLILSTDATLDGGDVVLSTISTSTGPGQVLAFTGLGQNLPVNTTRYLFVTGSVSGCGTVGSDINITSTPLSAITYADVATVKTGTPVVGTTKSIILGVLDDVTGLAAQSGQPTVQVNWVNPSCVTEVIIVAHTAPISGTPVGTYTGNLNYLSAPAFPGGGRVVYNGTTSPQTITGLTVNTLYYFKVFVRFNSNYSAGVQVTATPTLVNLYSRGSGLSHTDAIWSTSPTGTPQTLAAAGGMSASRGIVIQNGDDVQLSASGGTVLCRELIINPGGIFRGDGNLPGGNRFLNLFGDVTNNGTIGTGSTYSTLCFGIEGSTVNFNGIGVYNVGRIRKNTTTPNATSNLIINSNVNIRFPGGAALYSNQDGTRLNVLVSSGKTLTLTEIDGDIALDGTDGLSSGERSGNLIVNGTLNVGGTVIARNNNTGPGNTCAVTVASSGVINANSILSDIALGQGTNFNISAGGRVFVTGSLTVNSGNFSSNGGLVLKSSAAGTARVAPLGTGASITGNVTMERYFVSSGWQFVGSPVNGQTISSWNDDFQTQGPMPGVKVPNPGAVTSNIFGYDQSSPLNTNPQINGWIVPTTSGIPAGDGFRILAGSGPITLDNTGTINANQAAPFVDNLDYNGASAYAGYNLVSNPLPSSINWDNVSRTGSVSNTVITYNASAGAYQYYTAGGAALPPRANANILPTYQGYFVTTAAAGQSLTYPETAKSATAGTFVRTATDNSNLGWITISLKGFGKEDMALFKMDNASSLQVDLQTDAPKFFNPLVNIATQPTLNNILAINAMPETSSLPLYVGAAVSGNYTITLTGLQNLPASFDKVYLKDLFYGTMTQIKEGQEISVNFSDDVNSQGSNRFELVFESVLTSNLLSKVIKPILYPNPAAAGKEVAVSGFGNMNGSAKAQITDLQGKLISEQWVSLSKAVRVKMPTVKGIYTLTIAHEGGKMVEKIIVD